MTNISKFDLSMLARSIGGKASNRKYKNGDSKLISFPIMGSDSAVVRGRSRMADGRYKATLEIRKSGKHNFSKEVIQNKILQISIIKDSKKESLEALILYIKDNFKELLLDGHWEYGPNSPCSKERERVLSIVNEYPKNGKEHPYQEAHLEYLGFLEYLEIKNQSLFREKKNE